MMASHSHLVPNRKSLGLRGDGGNFAYQTQVAPTKTQSFLFLAWKRLVLGGGRARLVEVILKGGAKTPS